MTCRIENMENFGSHVLYNESFYYPSFCGGINTLLERIGFELAIELVDVA